MNLVSPAQINPFELTRNRVFLDLQERLGEILRVTQQADGGAVADPSACYERTHC
jgi:hypothetical protein